MPTEPVKATATAPRLLELAQVRKSFGGTQALRGVDFDLRAGEIHALLGENGAGKSTLIKVLGGIYRPDAGRILIQGEPAQLHGVAEADRLGIRIIHQELSLAPNLSVAENIYLGREPSRYGLLDRRKMFADAERLVSTLGLVELTDVRAGIGDLSVAHQQLVEIARAFSCRARILVLDEPTSSLSEAETELLFASLLRFRSQDVGIIYISHRLEEISRLADRVTVLRDGRSIGTQAVEHLNRRELVKWMVGREITEHFHRPVIHPGEVILEARNLRGGKVHGVSFEVHAGEIFGLVGLVGSGRSELARALFGIDPIEAGEIFVSGKAVRISSPADALREGIVLVPEDRKTQGLITSQTVSFNLTLPWVRDWIRGCMPNLGKRRLIVERAVRQFAIKLGDPEQNVQSLSGGNQQKTLLGKWMEHPPKVLLLDEPTRGVDVGAREEIFRFVGELVCSGIAVVLISSDLTEVMSMSHRIALYRDGRILREGRVEEFTPEGVMLELTGGSTREDA
jgi:ABC-type sugar transport system ATPase subunit